MKLSIGLAASALLAISAIAPSSVKAIAISNGSFELSDTIPDPGDFTQLDALNKDINDWSVTAGNIDYIRTFWTASQGSRSVDLAGTTDGTFSTNFNIGSGDVGILQTILFDLASNNAISTKDIEVSVTGEKILPYSINATSALPGTPGNLWTTFSYTFTPTSQGISTLTFRSLNASNNAGAALDNVRIEPVPYEFETASGVLLFAGYFVGKRYLKKRKSAK